MNLLESLVVSVTSCWSGDAGVSGRILGRIILCCAGVCLRVPLVGGVSVANCWSGEAGVSGRILGRIILCCAGV